ncbi:CopD family protein [Primorskyibacter sp. S87]|uniref:CopD family protein n=1 Tax=Primorskyibacter sp. S87 TaxID=3415126 RepID=UPI003C7DF872
MTDLLFTLYPWNKAIHIMAVLSWMAGLFYLPRLFVYHVERAEQVEGAPEIFQIMEEKLIRFIMKPAMVASWFFGLMMVVTPGIIDWGSVWPWTKGISVVAMTWFHFWLEFRRREFLSGKNKLSGRQYRLMNEVPTVLMIVIVLSVILKF